MGWDVFNPPLISEFQKRIEATLPRQEDSTKRHVTGEVESLVAMK